MENEELIQLIKKAQSGDTEVFEQIFQSYYDKVFYFALKTVQDRDLACDITQETFLEVISTIQNLREPGAFGTWILRIAYHQCTRYFKKRKDEVADENEDESSVFDTVPEESVDANPDSAYEQEELSQIVHDLVDDLSETQRSAVMLYYFEELSVSQIASIQGVSDGTVKSRLNYSRKALQKAVTAYEKKTGIRLHTISFLPLFMLYFKDGKALSHAESAALWKAVESSAGKLLSPGTEKTAAAQAAKSAAGKAAGKTAKATAVKVIAGTLAAGGIVAGSVALIHKSKPVEPAVPETTVCAETVTPETTVCTETAAPETTQPAPVPLYESEDTFVYGSALNYQGQIQDIHLGSWVIAELEDGSYQRLDKEEKNPLGSVGTDFFTSDCCFGYTASDGNIHVMSVRTGTEYVFQKPTGKILACQEFGRQIEIISFDGSKIYYSKTTGDGGITEAPVVFKAVTSYDALLPETFDTFRDVYANNNRFDWVEPFYTGGSSLCLITQEGDVISWCMSGGSLPDPDGNAVLIDKVAFDHISGDIFSSAHSGIGETPLYTKDGDDSHLYGICSMPQTHETQYALPQGYGLSDIEKFWNGYVHLYRMNDGNIYVQQALCSPDTMPELDTQLTELWKGGHIVKMDVCGSCVVFLADDNCVYVKTYPRTTF